MNLNYLDDYKMYVTNSSRYNPTVPRDGLVGEYLFNGNANDTSGNANNGTVTNATLTIGRKGVADTAYLFSGNGFIDLGNSSLFNFTTAFTLSYWVYITQYYAIGQAFIAKGSGVDTSYCMDISDAINGNKQRFFGYNASNTVIGELNGPKPLLNQWLHIAATFNGTTWSVLYNNTNVILQSIPSTLKTTTLPVRLGGRGMDQYFNGKMDDVRLYNRVLSGSEITQLYTE
jgi:hypothetical protein